MTTLVPFAMLCETTGYRRVGEVTRCLRRQGIAFFLGKGGEPWTTTDLINAAAGLTAQSAANAEMYPTDIVIQETSP
jgi:hypothetical protein